MKNQSVTNNLDWITVAIYIVMVILGWLNIYSSSLSSVEGETSIFDVTQIYGKQFLFILFSIPIIISILAIDAKFFEKFSGVFYILGLLSLAGLFVFGKEIKGQTNWYSFGSFSLQPAEFAKTATALLLAKYLSDVQVNLKDTERQLQVLGILL